jgi:ribosomal protein S18 acetylase RimI-like enzyme
MQIRDMTGDDRAALLALLQQPDVFEPREMQVAEELIDAHLSGSPDYRIHLAVGQADATPPALSEPAVCAAERRRVEGRLLGYVCYGHNPVTDAVYDVYWIVVAPGARRRGAGRALLEHTEQRVREMAGRAIVIETSGRPDYEAARAFYESCGYARVAEIADFYQPGDAMHIYMKTL